MKRPGLLEIVESCYALDGDLEHWMKNVGSTVDAHLGYGLGVIGVRYRLDESLGLQPLAMLPINMSADAMGTMQRAAAEMTPSYAKATFASTPAATASSTGSAEIRAITNAALREYFEPLGWHDIFIVNGLDPTHHGYYLGAWMPKRSTMTGPTRARWSRIAAHVAAAHRLRVRLSASELRRADTAEAVLTPSGRVEHANDEAKVAEARTALADGVRRLVHARGKRRSEPRTRSGTRTPSASFARASSGGTVIVAMSAGTDANVLWTKLAGRLDVARWTTSIALSARFTVVIAIGWKLSLSRR